MIAQVILRLLLPVVMAQDWDIGVAFDDRIEFYSTNGGLVGSVNHFTSIQGATYDTVDDILIVNTEDHTDSNQDSLRLQSNKEKDIDVVTTDLSNNVKGKKYHTDSNQVILTFQLSKEKDVDVVTKDLSSNAKSLSIDPISKTLFWLDVRNQSINAMPLNGTNPINHGNVLYKSTDKGLNLEDISVDACNSYVYWTGTKDVNCLIGRVFFNASYNHEVIQSYGHTPRIIVDYFTHRLYWSTVGPGLYYYIKYQQLGKNLTNNVYNNTYDRPLFIAVDKDYIYWIDKTGSSIKRLSKTVNNSTRSIIALKKIPIALFTKCSPIGNRNDCQKLYEIPTIPTVLKNEPSTDKRDQIMFQHCLNNGTFVNGRCKCPFGFIGTYCDVSLCYNFCIHGVCTVTASNQPNCQCTSNHYLGSRCEIDLCDGYCLNNGECNVSNNGNRSCSCKPQFSGSRCEHKSDRSFINFSCSGSDLSNVENEFVCRYGSSEFRTVETSENVTFSQAWIDEQYLHNPVFLILSSTILMLLIMVVILLPFSCTIRRRPRIKKRIIVNKNVTPLTYRPQPTTEQCEITIENCCNMNVCETPCFEPSQLRRCQKSDDKKVLLSSMDTGEELY